MPPTGAAFKVGAVGLIPHVIVAVWSTEHHSVGDIFPGLSCHHDIAGVSAVPSHRQAVITGLITDGERRVFSRVPQSRINMLDLLTDTRY